MGVFGTSNGAVMGAVNAQNDQQFKNVNNLLSLQDNHVEEFFQYHGEQFLSTLEKLMEDVTERVAVASGEIKFDKETYKKIKSFETKKGNLEKTAIIGGIMGAKETSRLIPLCHNIPINHINIEVIKNDKS